MQKGNPHLASEPEDPCTGETTSALIGKRVVIIEDEGFTQLYLQKILQQAGLIIVGAAGNGPDGVAIALSEHPDIILMDIRMPGAFNGLEAARQILAVFPVCIVMLTALSEKAFQEEARRMGTAGFVVKPTNASSLFPLLEEAYRRFQQPEAARHSEYGYRMGKARGIPSKNF